MKVSRSPAAVMRLARLWRGQGLSVGFVPTMGALHEGHASLIRRARRENDRVIVSVFVNPLQFGPNEDYAVYPRTFPADRALCQTCGADALYHPKAAGLYPAGFATSVEVAGISEALEGRFRPGFFKGVATVVLKLLETVRPARAYFGEKDFQQLAVVKRMAADLGLGVAIMGCPTVREKDGLAMSSRNRYLLPRQRAVAPRFYRALLGARALAKKGVTARFLEQSVRRAILSSMPATTIDYVSLVDAATLKPAVTTSGRLRLLAAIRLGTTRLIDNIPISC